MATYPTVDFPTIVSGLVYGPKLRVESTDGSELLLDGTYAPPGIEWHFIDGMLTAKLKDCGPFERNGKMWGVTHLQKYSPKGFLKVSPDCYHRWYFWRSQKKDLLGEWIPGTECGIYFRKPFSWRWDVAGTMIDGELRHWIWTKGYAGLHWD